MNAAYTFSYDRLWHRLIDLKMKRKDLMQKAHLTTNAIAKMGKGEAVSLDTLAKICLALECNLFDLVELIPQSEASTKRSTHKLSFDAHPLSNAPIAEKEVIGMSNKENDTMKTPFILSCESTVDLPYSYVAGREIPVLFYSYLVDGKEYPDDMGRDPFALPRFYQFLSKGKIPSTSQINEYRYEEFFEELLQQGDVLHVAFGSGMTPSVKNALAAADVLREKYPNRKIEVIDSLCSSTGYGLLVDGAADLRDEGRTMEETIDWLNANRKHVHHQFFSTDLQYYRRSGRISGSAAALGTILSICPIMRLDDSGHIIAYDKVRGRRKAIEKTLDVMAEHAQGGTAYSGKCWICHSNCLTEAKETVAAIKERFPNVSGEIRICDIGTIIASHSGPGTVAVFFFGDERAPAHHS